jgi:predicted XRE-type DNA-binding protein
MSNVVIGKNNVFEDLGFEPEEAINLKIRADLTIDIQEFIQSQEWTQAEAAAFFNETQLRISNLMNGELDTFSIDELVQMLDRAGKNIQILVTSKAA